MKSHKFGVWGLALGALLLGAAACDDETEVVIPPPPPPPLVVTVSPATLSVEVGETAQFVATVAGGAEGTARTVTWTSSNTGVATVDANGLATAVTAGTTTIVATSTADATVQGAASLTVTDIGGAPVTITITSVTRGGTQFPVDRNNAFGQIDVTVDLQIPPGALVDRMEVLIDGTVLYSQSFATGAADVAAAEAELEAQAAALIVASINTATFDAATGDVPALFKNGPHALSARVIRPNGTVTATESITLVYNNENFINATYGSSGTAQTSEPAPRSLAPAGSLWHTGDITLLLVPVNFGSADEAVASISATLISSGDGASGVDGCVPALNAYDDPTIAEEDRFGGGDDFPECGSETVAQTGATASPVTLTFPADDDMDDGGFLGVEDIFETIITSVTTGGQAGPDCVNPDPNENPHNFDCETFFANPLRVDNLAPRVTQLSIERPPNQYFGPNVFVLDHDAGGTVDAEGDPCEAPCARSVDYGVGGTVPTFTAGPIGEEVEVTDGGAELEESATSEDYVFAVTVTDKSGNADTRWATNPDDNDSGDVSTTTDEPEDDAATQFFGWDATAPEIELTAGPDDMEANPDEATATIGFSDSSELPAGPSGFLADPVQLKTERYLPAGVTCRDAEDAYSTQSCTDDNGFVPSDGDWDMPSAVPQEGYFRFTAFVADAAGNVSEELTFWILYDTSDPDVGGISAPSTIEGGASATFSADLEDNVDLGSLQPFVGFAGLFLNFPHTGGSNGLTVFNDYSPTSLIDEDGGTVTFASFVRSIEDASGSGGVPPGAFTEADQMLYLVRDMAGHQLRFVQLPWKGAPDDGVCAGQNCFDRVVGIGANVDGPDDPAFTLLSDLNADGLNPGDALELPADATGRDPAPFAFNWGSWRVLPWAAGVSVCNNADEEDCSTAEDNTTIAMEAVVQGPRGSFATPFAAVWFVYLNGEGNLQFISTASATVTDNTIEETRTVRYRATWDATDLRVRPAGDPGTTYTVYAVGITADGDALLSVGQEVIVEGN